MFKRILMPVDLSDQHDAALNMAAELSRAADGEIVLVHVIEVITGLTVEEERPFYDRLEPQVWFRSVEDAQRAGFTSWERPR